MRHLKKAAKFTAVAVAFGVIASTAYQGSNYLYIKTEAGAESTAAQTTLNMASAVSSTSDSESAEDTSVAGIAQAAMPSLVAITGRKLSSTISIFFFAAMGRSRFRISSSRIPFVPL